MPQVKHLPKFQMAHNTWVPILSIFPILGIFSWVLPLHKHVLLPGTLVGFFLSRHKFFSYLGKPSNYVVPISLLVPYPLIFQFLTWVCQWDYCKKLEYFTFVHTKSQMGLIQPKLESDCYTQILPSINNPPTYLVYPLRTF